MCFPSAPDPQNCALALAGLTFVWLRPFPKNLKKQGPGAPQNHKKSIPSAPKKLTKKIRENMSPKFVKSCLQVPISAKIFRSVPKNDPRKKYPFYILGVFWVSGWPLGGCGVPRSQNIGNYVLQAPVSAEILPKESRYSF